MGSIFSTSEWETKILSIEEELKENYIILKNPNTPQKKKKDIITTLKPINRKEKYKKKVNHWKSQRKTY